MTDKFRSMDEMQRFLFIGSILFLLSIVFATTVFAQSNVWEGRTSARKDVKMRSTPVAIQHTTPSPTPSPSPTVVLSPTPTASPFPTLVATAVDDTAKGTGPNQFSYIGPGWQSCTGCGPEMYNGGASWSGTANDYVTIIFSGVQIKLYGVVDVSGGIGAVSVDGGSETLVDYYSATRAGNKLLWSSPLLAGGNHIFKLRLTGSKNAASKNVYANVDRVDILTRPAA